MFFAITALHAQSGPAGIELTDIRLTRTGENVTVSFTLETGSRVVRSGESLVIGPVLRSGGADAGECKLPPLVIRGRRSRLLDARHALAGGGNHDATYIVPGHSAQYVATVPHKDWMDGARVILEGAGVSCGPTTEITLGTIADNILDTLPRVEIRVVEVPVEGPKTTGERLAVRYPFIAPASELERIERPGAASGITPGQATQSYDQQMIEATRQGSISIFFPKGGRTIDRNFGANNTNLVELISAVRALVAAGDVEIRRIVIAGFASPEGSVALNNELSHYRAVAVKEFLAANSDTDPQKIQIYNGGVDWAGLRSLVEQSDIYRKQRLIEIIDTTPVWDASRNRGRLGELMRESGGEPYRQMERDFFPLLRQAAYIKVYFDNKR